jgi:hypothetical protein
MMTDVLQYATLTYEDLMLALIERFGDTARTWRIVSVTSDTDLVAQERIKVWVRPKEDAEEPAP